MTQLDSVKLAFLISEEYLRKLRKNRGEKGETRGSTSKPVDPLYGKVLGGEPCRSLWSHAVDGQAEMTPLQQRRSTPPESPTNTLTVVDAPWNPLFFAIPERTGNLAHRRLVSKQAEPSTRHRLAPTSGLAAISLVQTQICRYRFQIKQMATVCNKIQ